MAHSLRYRNRGDDKENKTSFVFTSSSLFLFFLLFLQLHIPGHAGYRGNEEADRLSREGAAKSLQQQQQDEDDDDLLQD